MGGSARELDLKVRPPVKIMLVGLQGAGKTTTLAKLARFLKLERKRHPLMVATDVRRPAAMEQLRVLGVQVGVPVVDTREDEDPVFFFNDTAAPEIYALSLPDALLL